MLPSSATGESSPLNPRDWRSAVCAGRGFLGLDSYMPYNDIEEAGPD